MSTKRFRKGQTLSSDFIISISIFLVLLTGSAIIWNTTAMKYSQSRQQQFMQEKIFSISDVLIRTEGYPPGWNSNNVRLIGLSQKDSHILSAGKFKELKNLDASTAKRLWGIEGYEYLINVTNTTGGVFTLSDGTRLEYESTPLIAKQDLVPLRRLVLINESGDLKRAAFTLMIWR